MKLELKKGTNKNGKPFTAATIKHQIVLLRRLFNLAIKWRIYNGPNPVSSVELPKLDNEITEFLTEDEMRRLLETLDSWPCKRSVDFVMIAMLTGLRKGEIRKLQWPDLDLERKTLTILDPKGKKATIPLSDEAASVFLNIERTSSPFVVPGVDGGMKKTFRDPWYAIRKAANLPPKMRFHGLRHNFASWLVSHGVPLYTVGKALNQKTLSSTKRYAHLADLALRQAVQKSGELLTPKHVQVLKIAK
jgi:integrase